MALHVAKTLSFGDFEVSYENRGLMRESCGGGGCSRGSRTRSSSMNSNVSSSSRSTSSSNASSSYGGGSGNHCLASSCRGAASAMDTQPAQRAAAASHHAQRSTFTSVAAAFVGFSRRARERACNASPSASRRVCVCGRERYRWTGTPVERCAEREGRRRGTAGGRERCDLGTEREKAQRGARNKQTAQKG